MQIPEQKVSVIIPAYNAEHTLESCLDSVMGQSLKPHEIIVIDDGSTDETSATARRLCNEVILIRQKNMGQGAARNAGFSRATGDYIAYLDADDFWMPDFLGRTTSFLAENPEAVAVLTAWIKRLDEQTDILVPPIMTSSEASVLKAMILDNFFDFWAEQDHVQTGAILIRRNAIEQAGPQREDLRNSQDLEHWALIATYGKWGFIPEVHYVNNSRMAARGNWLAKYNKRRQLCPDVGTWEERILPRLKKADISGFNIIRGRVAAGYAHNKILAGNYSDAFKIVRNYGCSMPDNRLANLMKAGACLGYPGWLVCCLIIRAKELHKAWQMDRKLLYRESPGIKKNCPVNFFQK